MMNRVIPAQRREVLAKYLGLEALLKTAQRAFRQQGGGYACEDGLCVMASLVRDAGRSPSGAMPGAEEAFRDVTGRSYDPRVVKDIEEMDAISDLIRLNDRGYLITAEAVRWELGLKAEEVA